MYGCPPTTPDTSWTKVPGPTRLCPLKRTVFNAEMVKNENYVGVIRVQTRRRVGSEFRTEARRPE